MLLLLSRAASIVVRPRATWHAIANERAPASAPALYAGYIVPLAAIGPVATFVALHVVGVRIARGVLYRASASEAFAQAGVSFAYALTGVVLIAAILSALAPLFGARRGFARALRVTAFAYTPAWIASVVLAYPPISAVQLAGVAYALYLLGLGLHTVMLVPRSTAIVYALAAVACSIGVAFALGALGAELRGVGPAYR